MQPYELLVGLRYTRAKRRNHFISFISMTSMIGLSLGVLAMIVVLSVMNGFQRELSARNLGLVPHARSVARSRCATGAVRLRRSADEPGSGRGGAGHRNGRHARRTTTRCSDSGQRDRAGLEEGEVPIVGQHDRPGRLRICPG